MSNDTVPYCYSQLKNEFLTHLSTLEQLQHLFHARTKYTLHTNPVTHINLL